LNCKGEALSLGENRVLIEKNNCILCGTCHKLCPTEAIEMIGSAQTIEQVMKEIGKDMVFYEQSGGGVTFSGGEPMMQIEFLDQILMRCKEKKINTVVDTSGYTPYSSFERILDKVDLFLFDLKHMDEEKHKKYTGVSNKLILDNLAKLSQTKCDIWIRIPIIPGVNDDDTNILKTGEYISKLGLSKVNILPYHDIAVDKYKRLGKNYALSGIESPSETLMEEIADKFKGCALKVKIGG